MKNKRAQFTHLQVLAKVKLCEQPPPPREEHNTRHIQNNADSDMYNGKRGLSKGKACFDPARIE